jgi:hypothetical protein
VGLIFDKLSIDGKQLAVLAHWLVVTMAAVLPWSTSGLSILLGVWVVILIPIIKWNALRAELLTPLGGLPVLLFLLALAGTFWSVGSPAERWDGMKAFFRFMAIPLLVTQYRRTGEGQDVLVAFMLSCSLLLIASYIGFFGGWPAWQPGVPVKDYIAQSLEFAICAALLFPHALEWREPRRAIAAVALAIGFLANISFVATGRTALVVIAALVLAFGFRAAAWKGTFIAGLVGLIGLAIVWEASPFLRDRVLSIPTEIKLAETSNALTSSGERLAFWRKSLHFIEGAPLIGNGVGSIPSLYRKTVVDQTGVNSIGSTNPHNQTFAIGIQLGLVGVILLWLMWHSQLFFFRHSGAVMWVGTVLVVQNVVGSLFNSLIFDFTEGWLYIIGVGVTAGVALRHLPRNDSLGRKRS